MRMWANSHQPHDAIDLFIDIFFFSFHNSSSAFLCSKWVGFHPPEQSSYSASPYVCRSVVQQKLTWMKCNFHWIDRATRWVSHWADQYCTQRGYSSSQSCSRASTPHCHPTWLLNYMTRWGASVVTILWQPSLMLWGKLQFYSRTLCHVKFCFFLSFADSFGFYWWTNSVQLFCGSFLKSSGSDSQFFLFNFDSKYIFSMFFVDILVKKLFSFLAKT